jgi:uncharacterized protein YjiS (DUF1127 family)
MIDLLIQTDRRFADIRRRARMHHTRRLRWPSGKAVRAAFRGVRRLVAWQRRRRLIAELSALDDVLLADIGMYRGDILPTVDELMRRHRLAVDESAARHGDLSPAPHFEPAGRPVLVAPAPPIAQNDNVDRQATPMSRTELR